MLKFYFNELPNAYVISLALRNTTFTANCNYLLFTSDFYIESL
jgi:hypothetical protein